MKLLSMQTIAFLLVTSFAAASTTEKPTLGSALLKQTDLLDALSTFYNTNNIKMTYLAVKSIKYIPAAAMLDAFKLINLYSVIREEMLYRATPKIYIRLSALRDALRKNPQDQDSQKELEKITKEATLFHRRFDAGLTDTELALKVQSAISVPYLMGRDWSEIASEACKYGVQHRLQMKTVVIKNAVTENFVDQMTIHSGLGLCLSVSEKSSKHLIEKAVETLKDNAKMNQMAIAPFFTQAFIITAHRDPTAVGPLASGLGAEHSAAVLQSLIDECRKTIKPKDYEEEGPIDQSLSSLEFKPDEIVKLDHTERMAHIKTIVKLISQSLKVENVVSEMPKNV